MFHKRLLIEEFGERIVGLESHCCLRQITPTHHLPGNGQHLDGPSPHLDIEWDFCSIFVGHKQIQHDESRLSLPQEGKWFLAIPTSST